MQAGQSEYSFRGEHPSPGRHAGCRAHNRCVLRRIVVHAGETAPVDRHRRHRGRVLSVRRRHRQGHHREPSGRRSHRGSDGGVGRQPEVPETGHVRHRVHDGRHRAGRDGRQGRVRGHSARCPSARSPCSIPATCTWWRWTIPESPASRTCAAAPCPPARPAPARRVLANRILQAAGLDPQRDIRAQSLGVAQSVDALKDGKIDAFFWNAGLPTASILDLVNTPGFTPASSRPTRSCRALNKTLRAGSLYFPAVIPKGTYKMKPTCRSWPSPISSSCPNRCQRHSPTTSRAALRAEKRPRRDPSAGQGADDRDGAEGIADSVSSGGDPLLPRTEGVDD